MKLRTDSQLQEYLDDDFAWRVKEIDRLKTVVSKAVGSNQDMLIRAGVPLVYAHWEGFIKAAAEGMLCFVAGSRRSYRELAPCFTALGVAKELDLLTSSKKEHVRVAALKFLMANMDAPARFSWQGRASAGGNLNFERFRSIAAAVGVEASRYETRSNFVDRRLLRRRNEIAHGARMDLDQDGFADIADGVLLLLRWFKTDLENSIALKSYLAATD